MVYWIWMCLWGKGRGFECGKKNGPISKRGNFSWNGKTTCEEASHKILKSYLSFGGDLEGSNEKKWGGNRKKSFYSEILGSTVWGGLAKVPRDSPCATVLWKLSLSKNKSLLRGEVGWDMVATGCKGVSGYCYHCWFFGAIVTICVDVCLGSKKGRFLGEAVTAYLPSGSNKVKVWRGWSGFLLVGCCGWVVTLGSAGVEICWVWGHWESEIGCVGSWGMNLMAREPSWEQNGLLPMVNIIVCIGVSTPLLKNSTPIFFL